LHFESSHGNCDEAQTPQDLCTSLLLAKAGGGLAFDKSKKQMTAMKLLFSTIKVRCTTTIEWWWKKIEGKLLIQYNNEANLITQKKHDQCKINNSSCSLMKPNHTQKTRTINDEAIITTWWNKTKKLKN
jgi:hypothetical protein